MEKKTTEEELVNQATRTIEESVLKEGFMWSKVQQCNENGKSVEANDYKLKFAALRKAREEMQEWLDYLTKSTENVS